MRHCSRPLTSGYFLQFFLQVFFFKSQVVRSMLIEILAKDALISVLILNWIGSICRLAFFTWMIWCRQDLSVTNFDTVGSLDFGLFEITILDYGQLRFVAWSETGLGCYWEKYIVNKDSSLKEERQRDQKGRFLHIAFFISVLVTINNQKMRIEYVLLKDSWKITVGYKNSKYSEQNVVVKPR